MGLGEGILGEIKLHQYEGGMKGNKSRNREVELPYTEKWHGNGLWNGRKDLQTMCLTRS